MSSNPVYVQSNAKKCIILEVNTVCENIIATFKIRNNYSAIHFDGSNNIFVDCTMTCIRNSISKY